MRIGIIGDLHLHSGRIETRTDDSGETVLQKFGMVLKMFDEAGIRKVICTGDLCHSSLQSKAYQARLTAGIAYYKNKGMDIYSAVGNHIGDQKEKTWETYKEKDLGILEASGLVKVPCWEYISDGVLASFIHAYRYDFAGKYFKDTVEKEAEIVVAHYFLNTGWDDLIVKFGDLKRLYPKMKWLVLGHDHSTFQPEEHEGVTLVAPGSLLRTSFRERDREVFVAILDTDIQGPQGIQFLKVGAAEGKQVFQTEVRETEKEAEEQLSKFMSSLEDVKLRQGEMIDFINAYLAKIPDNKVRDKFKALLTQAGVI